MTRLKTPPLTLKEVPRLTVLCGEMQKKTIVKSKFWQINDKRFYFPDGIVSLPLSHPSLKELNHYIQKRSKDRGIIMGRKTEIGNRALEFNKRLFLYH